jgi:2-haloacid dehalogenase
MARIAFPARGRAAAFSQPGLSVVRDLREERRMSKGEAIAGVIFDAYGTLFDVYAIEALMEELFPGKGVSITRLWRQKQIEYCFLRTTCGQYAEFWQVTIHALEYACDFEKVRLDPDTQKKLMQEYRSLPPHPEVCASLLALKERGLKLAVLSNGNSAMLDAAIQAAGLQQFFDYILSVDQVRKFKSAPEAYQLGPDAFGCSARYLLFVSSNGWDIAGASWFGYPTFWINRSGAPRERVGTGPAQTGSTMTELVRQLTATPATQRSA